MKAETEADRHPVMKEGDAGKITGICFSFFFFLFLCVTLFLSHCLFECRTLTPLCSLHLPAFSLLRCAAVSRFSRHAEGVG